MAKKTRFGTAPANFKKGSKGTSKNRKSKRKTMKVLMKGKRGRSKK